MWPFSSWLPSVNVPAVVEIKRAARAAAVDDGLRLAGHATEDSDKTYTTAEAVTIVEKIRSKEWSCLRVMQAFVRASARAHKQTNCLTEPLFVQALQAAAELDEWIKNASDEALAAKVLLGLPISLKDQLNVKGVDSSMGFARYVDRPASEDGLLVDILHRNGAIPFCKTNVPQTMLAFECSNPLFGRTDNPFSALHVPGGSSGGEGALLALNGSPLGIGSDIGGSLRIPAHYSGIYALKPVFGRFPSKGSGVTAAGFEGIRSSLGPMGRSVQDLELCTRAIINTSHEMQLYRTQSLMPPLPYRDVKIPSRLRIGFFIEDGFIPTSPACDRAVQIAIDAVRAAGHEVVQIRPPNVVRAMEVFQGLASSDGYTTLLSHLLPNEPREPALFLPVLGTKIPEWLRSLASWVLNKFAGEIAMSKLVAVSRKKTTEEVWKWQHQRNLFVEEVRTSLWNSQKLDAIICPTQAVPAVTHGAAKRLSPLAIQTILWNVVDSTVGLIPVTHVDAELDVLPDSFNNKIRLSGSPLLSKLCYEQVYNSKAMHGLPVGIQLVTSAWDEERMLEMMKVVDQALTEFKGPFQRRLHTATIY